MLVNKVKIIPDVKHEMTRSPILFCIDILYLKAFLILKI